MPHDSHEPTVERGVSPWRWIAWTLVLLVSLWVTVAAVHRYQMVKIRSEVESRGGRLEGRELSPGWYRWLEAKAPTDWLKQMAIKGRANFRRVHAVSVPPGSELPPDFVSRLTIFRHVRQLQMANCNLDDRDLERLPEFRELTYLNLSGNRVSDNGVVGLDRLPLLRTLELAETRVGDGVLRQLSSHPSLVSVNVSGTLVTDDGLRAMGSPRRLCYLYLSGTRVSDSGLAALNTQPYLKLLELTGCPISDRGLQEINDARFPSLNTLHLKDTQVTADGIATMKVNSPRDLKWLNFPNVPMENHHWESLAAIKSLVRLTWGDVQLRRGYTRSAKTRRSLLPLDSFEVMGLPGRKSYPYKPVPPLVAPPLVR